MRLLGLCWSVLIGQFKNRRVGGQTVAPTDTYPSSEAGNAEQATRRKMTTTRNILDSNEVSISLSNDYYEKTKQECISTSMARRINVCLTHFLAHQTKARRISGLVKHRLEITKFLAITLGKWIANDDVFSTVRLLSQCWNVKHKSFLPRIRFPQQQVSGLDDWIPRKTTGSSSSTQILVKCLHVCPNGADVHPCCWR